MRQISNKIAYQLVVTQLSRKPFGCRLLEGSFKGRIWLWPTMTGNVNLLDHRASEDRYTTVTDSESMTSHSEPRVGCGHGRHQCSIFSFDYLNNRHNRLLRSRPQRIIDIYLLSTRETKTKAKMGAGRMKLQKDSMQPTSHKMHRTMTD